MKQIFAIAWIFLFFSPFFYTSCVQSIIEPDEDDMATPVDSTYHLRFSIVGTAIGMVNTSISTLGPHRPLGSIKSDELYIIIGNNDNGQQFELEMWNKPQVGNYTYSNPMITPGAQVS